MTIKSANNPPHVNDQIFVEFTLQYVGDNPIKMLGAWVTAYDPFETNKDFGYLRIDKFMTPQEIIKISGNRIVDAGKQSRAACGKGGMFSMPLRSRRHRAGSR